MSRGMSGPGASYRAGVAYGAIFGPYGSDPYAGMYGGHDGYGRAYGEQMSRPGTGAAAEQPATTGTSTKAQDMGRKVQNKCDEALTAAAAGKPNVARFKITAARNLASKAPAANGVRDWLLEQVAACSAQVESTLAAQAPAGGSGGGSGSGADQGGFWNTGPTLDMTQTGDGSYAPISEDAQLAAERTRLPWPLIGLGVLLTGAGLWIAAGKGVASRAAPLGNPRRRRSRRSRR